MKAWGLLLSLAALSSQTHRATAAEGGIGASLPWHTYEAELAGTTGTVLGPDYTGHSPAREASGGRCVKLSVVGQFVQFTAAADAQAIVVRYCLPDSTNGQGTDATLSLSINGHPHGKLPLTSRLTYLYGTYPYTNAPAAGTPRHFWDEVRLMPGDIHRGDTVRLQKNADGSASECLIDLLDMEAVPPPLPVPANALSVTDFGASPDGRTDARPAILAALAAARQQHKTVFIPAGRFMVRGPVELSDVTLSGAGMWYSTLVGTADYTPNNRVAILGNGSNIALSDFAIVGNLNYRDDSENNDGLTGSFGTGSSIRNVWVEHTKTGAWLTNSDGLVVEGCRFRDTIADGINLCVGMRNTTVRNCTARGTGDDCFAAWPATYSDANYSPGVNRFTCCTAQLPYLAQGFSIYGGEANSVDHCEAIDICYGAGILVSTTFPTQFGFRGVTTFSNCRLTRTGDADGAIATFANQLNLAGLRFSDIDVLDSPHDGIKFTSIQDHALSDTAFKHIRIDGCGLAGKGVGVLAAAGAVGSASFDQLIITRPRTAAILNRSSKFKIIEDDGAAGFAADNGPAGGQSQ